MSYRVAVFERERWRAALFGVGAMLALLAYGLILDPDTGRNGVPCLWKTFFGFRCPGCGLSRAGALLLRGRLREAVTTNFLIAPFVFVFVRQVFMRIAEWIKALRQIRLLRRNARWQN